MEHGVFNGLQVVSVLGSYKIVCPEHPEAFIVHDTIKI
jgi:hypothetical protein